MNNYYEQKLVEIASWLTRDVMKSSKSLNGGRFLRARTGWERRAIKNGESIYEHSCKVALAAYNLIKTQTSLNIGFAHDFPELIEFDHIPWEINSTEKKRRELIAMEALRDELPNGDYWFDLWNQYLKLEGNAFHIFELDKICPAIQALEYMKTYKNNKLEEFYPYSRSKLKTEGLIKILDEMYRIEIPFDVNPYDIYFEKLSKLKV